MIKGSTRAPTLLLALAMLASPVLADDRDPLEPVNRAVFAFNDVLDRAMLRPVATVYTQVTPDPLEQGVRNFFANLGEVRNATNNLLQAKWGRTATATGRFAINSTVGVAGLFDVASKVGVEPVPEDFGQTLGYWGVGHGPYLILPLLGPSSLRDGSGMAIDVWQNPLQYAGLALPERAGLVVVNGLQTRADLLGTDRLFAGDTYPVMREAYFSMREHDVQDGKVTSDAFLDDDNADEDGFIDESF